jgi:hypothetical protein
MKKHILKQGNWLYMGFFSLKVRDFLQVARCLKCHDLHYMAKYYSNEECCGRYHKLYHKNSDLEIEIEK